MQQQLYGLEDRDSKEKCKTVAVKEIALLYQIADANLLEYLVNVSYDWNDPNKRVYIFQHSAPIQDELNSFYLGLNKK